MSRPDVLLVSLGTTLGLRVSDSLFLDDVRAAGASAEAVRVRMGWTDRLRRGYPVNDLVEALACRRAAATAARRLKPRAVVLSTTTAAMLHPPFDVPYAVRLDAPAALNRPGARNAVLRPLERRGLGGARLVLPSSRAALRALPDGVGPAIVVPLPVRPSGPAADPPDDLAVSYVPDPKAKGLEILCAGWARGAPAHAELAVFGIERERALRHLRRTGVPEPARVRWRGLAPAAEFRATLRRARAYVGAARWEDHGQAPLEALADGALLVTAPSGGPFEALALARELEPSLVADAVSAEALGRCIAAAFELDPERLRSHRERAARRLERYAPEAVARTVSERVLPELLSQRAGPAARPTRRLA